jgi:hypothetical protein
MKQENHTIMQSEEVPVSTLPERIVIIFLCILLTIPGDWALLRANNQVVANLPEREAIELEDPNAIPEIPVSSEVTDSIPPTEVVAEDYTVTGKIPFDPSPTRAVWLSALCPGLGQIYNRRYWKLPIVIGGFMGLGYATNWNNNQYQDYMQGYRDLLDSDPSTNSYMDFFAPTVKESDLSQTWLQQTFKTRKDYYRRYRDMCIIFLVLFYALCAVDAYVDASMAHFDISPDLSLDWSPALLQQHDGRGRPAIGLNWALTF